MKKNTFYLYWAGIFLLLTAVAFAPRYWIPMLNGSLDVSSAIHWHAVFTTVWILLYTVQVAFVTIKRLSLHRSLGYLGVGLAVGVIVSGFFVSTGLVEKAVASNSPGARPSLLINLLDMALFGVVYTMGLMMRTNPIKHKRLMTLASIILLNAAVFRIGRFIIGPGFLPILLAIVLTALLIVLFIITEKRHSQLPNRSFWKIAGVIIFVHVVRIPIAITPFWASIADWIMEQVN